MLFCVEDCAVGFGGCNLACARSVVEEAWLLGSSKAQDAGLRGLGLGV